jgi:3-oxoacyl-[acyl-carrier protein] reductase
MPLSNQVAVITGAAGDIGRAVAQRLRSAGAHLALTDLHQEGLEATGRALPAAEAEVLLQVADVTQLDQVAALAERVQEAFGRVDLLVNSHGVLRFTPLDRITKQEWDFVLDVNLGGTFLCCHTFARIMRAQRSGRIINLSSIAGQTGGIRSGAHYAASKAAVISLTKSLAKWLAADGVRVNAIAPSAVEGTMIQTFPEEDQAALVDAIPLRRFARPEEVAEIVCFLASPAADYLTGQVIGLNGGAYMAG